MPSDSNNPAATKPSAWLVGVCLLIVYIVWGTTYFAIKVAIQGIAPFFLVGTRFVVAGVAECSQWTVSAFEVSRGQVVENHSPILELTFGQLLLNVRLPFEQPVHGSIELGIASRIEAE